MTSDEIRLRFLSLNCWGLPDFITGIIGRKFKKNPRRWAKRTERIRSIANRFDSYDVVCLQEVWIQEDQEMFSSIGRERGFSHSHVFTSGLLGSSGLQILSKYPIEQVYFQRYRLNGQILRVDHGDYHAGKGFGFARIALNDTQHISVIVTHTIAQYEVIDAYHPDRISQVWDLSRFIQMTSRPDEPFITVGDMNCKPNSVEYGVLTQIGKLKDVLEDSPFSTSLGGNQRIDYIFYKECVGWNLVESKVVLNEQDFLYSDHFGISATFTLASNNERYSSSSSSKVDPSRGRIEKKTRKIRFANEATPLSNLDVDEDGELSSKMEWIILEQSAGLISQGTSTAKKRKTNHLIRSLIFMSILYLLLSIGSPSYYVGGVSVLMVVEFMIALFIVENEISALKQVHKEIMYFR